MNRRPSLAVADILRQHAPSYLTRHGTSPAQRRVMRDIQACRTAELGGQSVRNEWVVYAKPPFGGPSQVLKYLARYTHRVAISNHRLLRLKDGKVTFRWKDYANGNKPAVMTLEATEFIRRFLMHVMPRSFVRIRYYGYMANRLRAGNIARCRQLLGQTPAPETEAIPQRQGAQIQPQTAGLQR